MPKTKTPPKEKIFNHVGMPYEHERIKRRYCSICIRRKRERVNRKAGRK